MIGNDIVDIRQAKKDSNWKRKGFVEKIFTVEEQQFIDSSADPFTMVWSLWSMKESAYKLYLQGGKERFFIPKRISCKLFSNQKGTTQIEGVEMKTETTINQNYIYSTATLDNDDEIENGIFYLKSGDYKYQSDYTRQQITQHLADKFQLEKSCLKIKKLSNKVPRIFYKDQDLELSFSLSHHGNFGAFSILNS